MAIQNTENGAIYDAEEIERMRLLLESSHRDADGEKLDLSTMSDKGVVMNYLAISDRELRVTR